MADFRIGRFGGQVSAPTADSLVEGQAARGKNYRLTPPGPDGGVGLRPAPGNTRIYTKDMDIGGEDRLSIFAAEPSDFNTDTGAVLVTAEQSETGAIKNIYKHEDLTRTPYVPPDDEIVAAEFVHTEYTQVDEWDFIEDTKALFNGGLPYYAPGGQLRNVLSGNVIGLHGNGNILLVVCNHNSNLLGGAGENSTGLIQTIIMDRSGALLTDPGADRYNTGGNLRIQETFGAGREDDDARISDFATFGSVIMALAGGAVYRAVGLLQSSHPRNTDGLFIHGLIITNPAPFYVDNGGNSYTFKTNNHLAAWQIEVGDYIDIEASGSYVYDLVETNSSHMLVTAIDATPGAATITLTSLAALTLAANDAAWSNAYLRFAPISAIAKHTEDSFIAATVMSKMMLKRYTGVRSGDITLAESITTLDAAPYSLTRINKIVEAPNGGYIVFAATAASNKILKLSKGLAITKQVIFGAGGKFLTVATAGELGVCIGWAPTGAAHQIKIIEPETLETLGTLALSGGYDMVKGICQSRGRFQALIQTGRATEQSYISDGSGVSADVDWAIGEWAADYSFVDNTVGASSGPPVAFWP